jgi:hypothetical protein
MTLYVSNRDGNGKTDEIGHYRLPSNITSGAVLFPGLTVTQNSPLGLSVIVNTGDFRIDTGAGYAYHGWNGSAVVVTLSTADAANPRIDTIVVYVDKSETTSPSPPNNPNVAKIIKVNGTPGAVPTAPTGGTIQTAVGAGNPYIILADVRVNALATTVTDANITDRRTRLTIANDIVSEASILNGAVTVNKLGDGAVTSAKILDGTIATADYADLSVSTIKVADGAITSRKWKPGTVNSNFTPAGARWAQTTTGTWQTITNCSMTYTAGPTPERLFLVLSVMANKDVGTAQTRLAVNGVGMTQQMYHDASSSWVRASIPYVVDVTANSVNTLAIQSINELGGGTFSITNELARWTPKLSGFAIYNGP